MKIGNKLKALRVEKGFTPLDVAERLNISESTYRRFENDKSIPDIEMLDKITNEYNIKVEDILKDESIITNHNNDANSIGITIAKNFAEISQILSHKIIEQYEARIKDLESQLDFWKRKAQEK